jgi:hypothetical protein
MWANKDLGTGAPIIPPSLEGLDPQYQYGPNNTLAARVIGKPLGVAPAQVDYAVRSTFGALGANAVKIISSAVEYQTTGYVPPSEEMPFVDEVLAKYPTLNTGSIRQFYRNAERVDEIAKTLGHAAKYDPANVNAYILSSGPEVGLIDTYKKAREDLGELRASINQVRAAPIDAISPADKKAIIDQMLKAMIEQARIVNEVTDNVRQQFEANQSAQR